MRVGLALGLRSLRLALAFPLTKEGGVCGLTKPAPQFLLQLTKCGSFSLKGC